MSRRVHTADEVLRHAQTGATELAVAPGDLVTPLARDVAAERGVRLMPTEPVAEASTGSHPGGGGPSSDDRRVPSPRLRHVQGIGTLALSPFPVELDRPEMDVRLRDVLGSADGLPMAVGVMSLREGSFPWTLDYDEVQYVIEGVLQVTTADQTIVAHPGDVVAVPKGSSITFGTPSWTRFLYVTYPADWDGAA